MNFSQACERCGLDAETVSYYVSEKLVSPLYTGRTVAEAGEYAEQDITRLCAIANMRRLHIPLEQIRKILYDPKTAASITLNHYEQLNKKYKSMDQCLEKLSELDLANFQKADDVLEFFADLKLDLPLPNRDINHDDDALRRSTMAVQEEQLKEAHVSLQQMEKSVKKLTIFSLITLFLFLTALGFILAPYFVW